MRFWRKFQASLFRRWVDFAHHRLKAASDYEAAAATRRTTGWTPSTSDINTLIFGSLDTLRSRSRDTVRKNPWATNALDSFVGN